MNKILTGEADDTAEPAHVNVEEHVTVVAPSTWEFHCVMALAGCYMAMALTDWGAANGQNASASQSESDASVWVKICSQ